MITQSIAEQISILKNLMNTYFHYFFTTQAFSMVISFKYNDGHIRKRDLTAKNVAKQGVCFWVVFLKQE